MYNKDEIFVFDESTKRSILNLLDIQSNEEGYLVDNEDKVLTDQDFEPLDETEFGGILKGSKIPIRKDRAELVKYFVKKAGE